MLHQSWHDVQNRGTFALDCNQYWQAEPLLKQAVEQAKAFGDSDLRYAKSLGELGRLYTVRGKFAQAEPYFEEEYAVRTRALGKQDGQLLPATASLIKFYLNYGTASKAPALTKEMLTFVEGKVMDALMPVETTVKFKKGMSLEGYAGSADGTLHPTMEWALACDEVANAYKQRGDLAMADRLYKAALDVKANIVGKEHAALASSYDCVGMVCLARGDSREAASYFKDALSITQRMHATDNPEVFARLDKYARSLIKQGKYPQAEQLYLRAQRFWGPEPERDGERARVAFALGSLYCDQKKFAQAEAMLRRAVRLAESYHGPQSATLVPYLEKHAYSLYYLGRKHDQERLKARASLISGVM
jgi:tetratricopeptide (TPR) repeat protein